MARVKRGVTGKSPSQESSETSQRLLRRPPQGLSRRQAGSHQGRAVFLPRPPSAQASVSAVCGSCASTRLHVSSDLSYSRFIDGLNKAEIEVDRKVLADLAVHDPAAFTALAEKAKASLES